MMLCVVEYPQTPYTDYILHLSEDSREMSQKSQLSHSTRIKLITVHTLSEKRNDRIYTPIDMST